MKSEEITVESKDATIGTFKYTLEVPDSIEEAVAKWGTEECLAWLQKGRKADVNAQEWQKARGTKTVEIEFNGKKFRVARELEDVVKAAMAGQKAA